MKNWVPIYDWDSQIDKTKKFNPGLISDWKQEQPMNFTWDISKRPEY